MQQFAKSFVSHDLSVALLLHYRVTVMQQGLIVDQGSEDQVLINPRLITKNMIAAVPVPDIEKRDRCLIAGPCVSGSSNASS